MAQIINVSKIARYKNFIKRHTRFIKEKMPRFYELFVSACYRIYDLLIKINCVSSDGRWDDYWDIDTQNYLIKKPLVTIIVPNFNHEPFLRQRLNSIYGQTYTNYEVILLDDCSTDNSRDILNSYRDKYSKNTSCIFNDSNAGSPFKQWEKGIQHAKGELIWIAESDDYCEENFLGEMIKPFADESVMLAFAKSEFVRNEEVIGSTNTYLADIEGLQFNKNFFMAGADIVKKGFYYKNIIPNVSSAMFRNIGSFPQDIDAICNSMKLCGDWIFYLSIIKGGVIAYVNDTTNYYRIHEKSTSLKIQKEDTYYKEFEKVSKYIAQHFNIDIIKFKNVEKQLMAHYQAFRPAADVNRVSELYNIEKIKIASKNKKIRIIICGYSMIMGGGETFPIFLANALYAKGVTVTFFDYNMAGRDPMVRQMLNKSIPCVDAYILANQIEALRQLDADVIHSHNTMVDDAVSQAILLGNLRIRQVITLHGMYEAIDKAGCNRVIKKVLKTCKRFVYTTGKNTQAFIRGGTTIDARFVKIENGLPVLPMKDLKRTDYGISDDSFLLCLVSRGIPEKGWEEAIKIIQKARKISKRSIELIIIGDGDEYRRLKGDSPNYVHMLGNKDNVRDYFAMSDMAFLPSRFKGESFPLVLIDALLAGRPVIASNVGEIVQMLTASDGNMAGAVFNLRDWEIPIDEVADIVSKYVNSKEEYSAAMRVVKTISGRYNIEKTAEKYLQVYRAVLEEK